MLLLLLLLLLWVPPHCDAWDYREASPFGPSHWADVFPGCDSNTRQQSPMALTSVDRANNPTIAARYTFHRVLESRPTGESAELFLITSADAGGLIKTTPSEAVPYRVVSRDSRGVALSTRTLYLHSMLWHSGVEHTGVQATANLEVQILLADQFGQLPTVMVSQLLDLSFSASSMSSHESLSVPLLVLDSIGDSASSLAAGGAVSTPMSPHHIELFFNNRSLEQEIPAFRYAGSTTSPPLCSAIEQVLVLDFPCPITYVLYQRLLHSSGAVATNRPLQPRQASTRVTRVQVSTGYPMDGTGALTNTPAPTVIEQVPVLHSVMSEEAQRLRIVVIALGALCVALSIVLTTLVLARWEVIDLPMWLGGIAKPVEFWTNPASCRDYLIADSITPAPSSTGEALDEEADDGDERNEDAAGGHARTPGV